MYPKIRSDVLFVILAKKYASGYGFVLFAVILKLQKKIVYRNEHLKNLFVFEVILF